MAPPCWFSALKTPWTAKLRASLDHISFMKLIHILLGPKHPLTIQEMEGKATARADCRSAPHAPTSPPILPATRIHNRNNNPSVVGGGACCLLEYLWSFLNLDSPRVNRREQKKLVATINPTSARQPCHGFRPTQDCCSSTKASFHQPCHSSLYHFL